MARRSNQTASIGDNSGAVNAEHLRAFLERIERLTEEKKALSEDISEVYAEAKSNGFDTKIMRKVIGLRAMDRDKRIEQEALIDTYLAALGELCGTPLGDAAVAKEFA